MTFFFLVILLKVKVMTFFVIITTHTLSPFHVIVSPVFFVNSTTKKLRHSSGCVWCHPGRSAPHLSDATG